MADHIAATNPDLQLGSDMLDILDVVRRLSVKEIAPRAAEIDRTGEFPTDVYELFEQIGLVGLLVPEELGGAGASLVVMAMVYEEIAKASATCALILSNSIETLVPIAAFADDELRSEVLQRVLQGHEIPCFALTEPGAGSDATALQTRATASGTDWVLNGQKVFCTNGSVGGLFLVFAVTDPEARRGRRLSAFIVDAGSPGFSVGKDERTLGTRGSPLTPLMLDGVRVAQGRMVGQQGDGLAVAMHMLNESRVGAAAQCVGMSSDALTRATAYASERRQFGQAIIELQAVQLLLADMAIRTEASRALTLRAAAAHDASTDDAVTIGAAAKTFASDSAVATALDAIQVLGGYGVCQDYGVERILRDAKAYQIFDGTNQIQRLTIAKSLMGRLSVSTVSREAKP